MARYSRCSYAGAADYVNYRTFDEESDRPRKPDSFSKKKPLPTKVKIPKKTKSTSYKNDEPTSSNKLSKRVPNGRQRNSNRGDLAYEKSLTRKVVSSSPAERSVFPKAPNKCTCTCRKCLLVQLLKEEKCCCTCNCQYERAPFNLPNKSRRYYWNRLQRLRTQCNMQLGLLPDLYDVNLDDDFVENEDTEEAEESTSRQYHEFRNTAYKKHHAKIPKYNEPYSADSSSNASEEILRRSIKAHQKKWAEPQHSTESYSKEDSDSVQDCCNVREQFKRVSGTDKHYREGAEPTRFRQSHRSIKSNYEYNYEEESPDAEASRPKLMRKVSEEDDYEEPLPAFKAIKSKLMRKRSKSDKKESSEAEILRLKQPHRSIKSNDEYDYEAAAPEIEAVKSGVVHDVRKSDDMPDSEETSFETDAIKSKQSYGSTKSNDKLNEKQPLSETTQLLPEPTDLSSTLNDELNGKQAPFETEPLASEVSQKSSKSKEGLDSDPEMQRITSKPFDSVNEATKSNQSDLTKSSSSCKSFTDEDNSRGSYNKTEPAQLEKTRLKQLESIRQSRNVKKYSDEVPTSQQLNVEITTMSASSQDTFKRINFYKFIDLFFKTLAEMSEEIEQEPPLPPPPTPVPSRSNVPANTPLPSPPAPIQPTSTSSLKTKQIIKVPIDAKQSTVVVKKYYARLEEREESNTTANSRSPFKGPIETHVLSKPANPVEKYNENKNISIMPGLNNLDLKSGTNTTVTQACLYEMSRSNNAKINPMQNKFHKVLAPAYTVFQRTNSINYVGQMPSTMLKTMPPKVSKQAIADFRESHLRKRSRETQGKTTNNHVAVATIRPTNEIIQPSCTQTVSENVHAVNKELKNITNDSLLVNPIVLPISTVTYHTPEKPDDTTDPGRIHAQRLIIYGENIFSPKESDTKVRDARPVYRNINGMNSGSGSQCECECECRRECGCVRKCECKSKCESQNKRSRRKTKHPCKCNASTSSESSSSCESQRSQNYRRQCCEPAAQRPIFKSSSESNDESDTQSDDSSDDQRRPYSKYKGRSQSRSYSPYPRCCPLNSYSRNPSGPFREKPCCCGASVSMPFGKRHLDKKLIQQLVQNLCDCNTTRPASPQSKNKRIELICCQPKKKQTNNGRAKTKPSKEETEVILVKVEENSDSDDNGERNYVGDSTCKPSSCKPNVCFNLSNNKCECPSEEGLPAGGTIDHLEAFKRTFCAKSANVESRQTKMKDEHKNFLQFQKFYNTSDGYDLGPRSKGLRQCVKPPCKPFDRTADSISFFNSPSCKWAPPSPCQGNCCNSALSPTVADSTKSWLPPPPCAKSCCETSTSTNGWYKLPPPQNCCCQPPLSRENHNCCQSPCTNKPYTSNSYNNYGERPPTYGSPTGYPDLSKTSAPPANPSNVQYKFTEAEKLKISNLARQDSLRTLLTKLSTASPPYNNKSNTIFPFLSSDNDKFSTFGNVAEGKINDIGTCLDHSIYEGIMSEAGRKRKQLQSAAELQIYADLMTGVIRNGKQLVPPPPNYLSPFQLQLHEERPCFSGDQQTVTRISTQPLMPDINTMAQSKLIENQAARFDGGKEATQNDSKADEVFEVKQNGDAPVQQKEVIQTTTIESKTYADKTTTTSQSNIDETQTQQRSGSPLDSQNKKSANEISTDQLESKVITKSSTQVKTANEASQTVDKEVESQPLASPEQQSPHTTIPNAENIAPANKCTCCCCQKVLQKKATRSHSPSPDNQTNSKLENKTSAKKCTCCCCEKFLQKLAAKSQSSSLDKETNRKPENKALVKKCTCCCCRKSLQKVATRSNSPSLHNETNSKPSQARTNARSRMSQPRRSTNEGSRNSRRNFVPVSQRRPEVDESITSNNFNYYGVSESRRSSPARSSIKQLSVTSMCTNITLEVDDSKTIEPDCDEQCQPGSISNCGKHSFSTVGNIASRNQKKLPDDEDEQSSNTYSHYSYSGKIRGNTEDDRQVNIQIPRRANARITITNQQIRKSVTDFDDPQTNYGMSSSAREEELQPMRSIGSRSTYTKMSSNVGRGQRAVPDEEDDSLTDYMAPQYREARSQKQLQNHNRRRSDYQAYREIPERRGTNHKNVRRSLDYGHTQDSFAKLPHSQRQIYDRCMKNPITLCYCNAPRNKDTNMTTPTKQKVFQDDYNRPTYYENTQGNDTMMPLSRKQFHELNTNECQDYSEAKTGNAANMTNRIQHRFSENGRTNPLYYKYIQGDDTQYPCSQSELRDMNMETSARQDYRKVSRDNNAGRTTRVGVPTDFDNHSVSLYYEDLQGNAIQMPQGNDGTMTPRSLRRLPQDAIDQSPDFAKPYSNVTIIPHEQNRFQNTLELQGYSRTPKWSIASTAVPAREVPHLEELNSTLDYIEKQSNNYTIPYSKQQLYDRNQNAYTQNGSNKTAVAFMTGIKAGNQMKTSIDKEIGTDYEARNRDLRISNCLKSVYDCQNNAIIAPYNQNTFPEQDIDFSNYEPNRTSRISNYPQRMHQSHEATTSKPRPSQVGFDDANKSLQYRETQTSNSTITHPDKQLTYRNQSSRDIVISLTPFNQTRPSECDAQSTAYTMTNDNHRLDNSEKQISDYNERARESTSSFKQGRKSNESADSITLFTEYDESLYSRPSVETQKTKYSNNNSISPVSRSKHNMSKNMARQPNRDTEAPTRRLQYEVPQTKTKRRRTRDMYSVFEDKAMRKCYCPFNENGNDDPSYKKREKTTSPNKFPTSNKRTSQRESEPSLDDSYNKTLQQRTDFRSRSRKKHGSQRERFETPCKCAPNCLAFAREGSTNSISNNGKRYISPKTNKSSRFKYQRSVSDHSAIASRAQNAPTMSAKKFHQMYSNFPSSKTSHTSTDYQPEYEDDSIESEETMRRQLLDVYRSSTLSDTAIPKQKPRRLTTLSGESLLRAMEYPTRVWNEERKLRACGKRPHGGIFSDKRNGNFT